MAESISAGLKQASLVSKTDFNKLLWTNYVK